MTVEIKDYSSEGDGVARLDDGRAVFVEGGVRGDVCRIKLTKEAKRFCRAKIVELIRPSAHRVKPDCPYFGRCGGCDFRHITREEELFAKRKRVNDAMKRIGGLDIEVEDILRANEDGYRNKITFAVTEKGFGYRRKNSHDIIEVERCRLAAPGLTHVGGGVFRQTEISMGRLTFKLSNKSFFQVNTEAAVLLYDKVKEYAALDGEQTLIDLYCGAGSIALYLAGSAKRVIGIDIEPSAIEDACANAAANGIGNAEFYIADAGTFEFEYRPDCVVVDPPRGGLNRGTIERIIAMKPHRVVYVSCDPANLARDVKLFEGYTVERLCAVDMFPKTAHVETAALLCRKNH